MTMTPPTYDNISDSLMRSFISAISALQFHGKAQVETIEYRNASPRKKRHISMLGVIALLLITREQHQAVATAVVTKGCGEKIYWASNRDDISNQERTYYEGLLKDFKERKGEITIMQRIIEACRAQINLRVSSIVDCFSNQAFQFDESSASYQSLQSLLRSRKIIKATTSLQTALEWFLRNARQFGTLKILTIIVMMAFADTLTEVEKEAREILNLKQFRHIRRFGDYRKAFLTLRHECSKISDVRLGQLSLEHIPPPALRPCFDHSWGGSSGDAVHGDGERWRILCVRGLLRN